MNESMKILALIFLLIVSFCSVQAKPPEPPYEVSTYWNSEIITPDDPTTFQRITYIGEEKRKMYHRGTDRDRPSRFYFKARPYVYHAFYENGLAIELLIYYEYFCNDWMPYMHLQIYEASQMLIQMIE